MQTECHDITFHYTCALSVYVHMMVNFVAASYTHLLLQIRYISESKQWREEESMFLKQQRKPSHFTKFWNAKLNAKVTFDCSFGNTLLKAA